MAVLWVLGWALALMFLVRLVVRVVELFGLLLLVAHQEPVFSLAFLCFLDHPFRT